MLKKIYYGNASKALFLKMIKVSAMNLEFTTRDLQEYPDVSAEIKRCLLADIHDSMYPEGLEPDDTIDILIFCPEILLSLADKETIITDILKTAPNAGIYIFTNDPNICRGYTEYMEEI